MSRFKTPDHPKRRGIAISNYREFVNAGIHAKSPLGDAAGSILGDEGFRERVFKYLKIFPDKREIPEIKKIEKKYEIKDIVRSVADYYGVGEGDLL